MTNVTNPDIDTISNFFPVDPSQNDSTDNDYLHLINDIILWFFKSGAYGNDWGSVSLPASPSAGKPVSRYNTDVNELRIYVYDDNLSRWVVFDTMSNLPKTAFGDLRVAELSPIFAGSFEYTVDNTRLNTNAVNDGATITQANAMAVLTSGTTTNANALLVSKRHAKYRSGLGGLLRFTSLFTAGAASTEQIMGLADELGSSTIFENGYCIGYIGTVFGFHRFQNDTITTIELGNWDDPLDGSGISGMTIDLTKLNVWEIRYQYLGGGSIQLSIENVNTGEFVVVHTIHYVNTNTEPSTHNPNFHFTMWVENNASSSVIIKSSSYGYFTEGYTQYREIHQPQFSSEKQTIAGVTGEVALFTIQNKETYASKNNFIDIIIERISIAIEASQPNNLGSWRLVKNATIGGAPSYDDINTSDSVVSIDVVGTTVTDGETLVDGDLAGKNDKDIEDLIDFRFILGDGETLTLAVISANSATFNGSLLWKELF